MAGDHAHAHTTRDFSVAEHFAEGLLRGGQGDGASTEQLAVNPPRLVLGCCLASLGLHYALPLPLGIQLPLLPLRAALAAACVGGFLACGKRCMAELKARGSSPHHTEPTTALVTTGPYAFSRNPAYVGLQLIPCAFAIGANSLWPLCFGVPAVLGYLNFVVIAKEEELLARLFPDEWKKYSSSVRRWL